MLAGWLARHGAAPKTILREIARRFGYDLGQSVDRIRAWYAFDISCKGTVPPAIVCALKARDFEDAIRNAVSLGGDSDTLACITGGIAEARHGVPTPIAEEVRRRLDRDLLEVVDRFYRTLDDRA